MPRFARMIGDGMHARGHTVEYWQPRACLHKLPLPAGIKRWPGYADQFGVFRWEVASRLRRTGRDTLFVVTDQGLGMYVPWIRHRPHVIHCHDFLALRSALGEIPENPTGWSGRVYQSLIRRGFSQGKAFVSVSYSTQSDLHRFLPRDPAVSRVVHNGLNYPFRPLTTAEMRAQIPDLMDDSPAGCILHIGNNSWYKNRLGVLEIYAEYARTQSRPLPLWMVGPPPPAPLSDAARQISAGEVKFLSGLSNPQVHAAYCHAAVLLFPSLAEGFGWPIAEAMACGTRVITTNEAPMSEVGGQAAYYLRRKRNADDREWAGAGASLLKEVLDEPPVGRSARVEGGVRHVQQFDVSRALDQYESVYREAYASAIAPPQGVPSPV